MNPSGILVMRNHIVTKKHRIEKQKGEIYMLPIIIGLVIAGYVGYLIYRQVKNVKAGNFCGSCSGCPSAINCGEFKESKDNEGRQII